MPKTRYVWDEDNISHETDEDGNVTAAYTYAPKQYGELVSERRNGHAYRYYYDGLGSTIAMTDETGTVTDTFAYDAWGDEIARTGATETPFRWVGKVGYYSDAETAEFYVRSRRFIASGARWASKDQLEFVAGPNVYAYAHNTPIYLTDSSGNAAGLELCQCLSSCRSCNTFACLSAGAWALRARLETAIWFSPTGRVQGGPGDAFRHCFWSCSMVDDPLITVGCAKCIGDNHEEQNRKDGSAQAHIDMDLHNNAVGRQLEAEGGILSTCQTLCLDALADGRLMVIVVPKTL